ncbi:MAG TPA: hypothetical protein VIJ92_13795 [Ginsengibacter sp.]
MKRRYLFFLVFCLCSSMTTLAQPGNSSSKLHFTGDGKTYSFDNSDPYTTATGEVYVKNNLVTMASMMFTNAANLDTIIVLALDKNGLKTGKQMLSSQSLKIIFSYNVFGKGLLAKVLDNSKKEINASNYLEFSLLETNMGGTIEGSFSFTDVDYKKGKEVVARVKELSNGGFSGIITRGGNNVTATVAAEGQPSPGASLLFKDVETKLSVAEKNDIFSQSGFYYSAAKKELLPAEGTDIKNYKEFVYKIFPTDMNHDGSEEIFLYSRINYQPSYVAYFKKDNKYHNAGYFDLIGANDLCVFPTTIHGYNVVVNTLYSKPVKIYTFDGQRQQYFPVNNYTINKQKDLATSIEIISDAYTYQLKKDAESAAAPKEIIPKGSLSKGATLLFKDVKSKLSPDEKNAVFEAFGPDVSKDGKQFVDSDIPEEPFDATVECIDLNKDGKQEVFIVFGNSATSGVTGSSILLLIRDINGTFKPNLGFPAAGYSVTSKMNKGFPDIIIYGIGSEVPTWRWNGKEYVYYKSDKAK